MPTPTTPTTDRLLSEYLTPMHERILELHRQAATYSGPVELAACDARCGATFDAQDGITVGDGREVLLACSIPCAKQLSWLEERPHA